MMPENADRILVLTAGNSLLWSATWQPEGDFRRDGRAPDYVYWTEEPCLSEVEKRRTFATPDATCTGEQIHEELNTMLRESGYESHDECLSLAQRHVPLPGLAEPPGRYSAELATLLRFWRDAESHYESMAELASATWKRIVVLSSADPQDEAAWAGRHLRAILEHWTGLEVERRIELQSSDPKEQVHYFAESLAKQWRNKSVDFVISGGYKLYPFLIGRYIARNDTWRALYLHEQSDKVIVETCDTTFVEGEAAEHHRARPGAEGA